MEIFIVYWVAVVVLFIVGVIQLIIKSAKNQPLKPALKLIIASVILVVIGAGACALILSNLSIGH
ncbi:hypothetical protein [Pedobacter endophyticus]|uniref:DUF2768 domain-containing protein n=1 Tax=Pedobacter endophyticus TaxID=2789740 RepID=A0A7S9PZ16_9SPHI|nr:hypothetical protein [Pedobacter endophyticus]QPH39157.1 hypothetical protein IZT61_19200 [Pedobacter endophyticus]